MRSRLTSRSSLAASVLAVAIAFLSAASVSAADDGRGRPVKLDHFLCYALGGSLPIPIEPLAEFVVEDQFLTRTVQASQHPSVLCNPAEKTHDGDFTRIREIDHHLAFHGIILQPQPERTVVISNQFGAEQTLTVRDTRGLLVPTRKEPHPEPKGLDHFMCYDAIGGTDNSFLNFVLEDQFGFWRSALISQSATLFCNPAAKTHNEVTSSIQNRRDHLTCYFISTTGRRELSNQLTVGLPSPPGFGHVQVPHLLCVPSLKLSVDGVPVGRGRGDD